MEIISCFLDKKRSKKLFSERICEIDTVVVHAMSAQNVYPQNPFSVKKCLEIFITYEVSSHYLIDRRGKIYYLVPEEKKAWHAGISRMPPPDNRENVNDFSIGIELIGNETVPFENEQYAALNFLLENIKKRYNIKCLLGHSDIANQKLFDEGLRKDVKWDPGKMFDWNKIG